MDPSLEQIIAAIHASGRQVVMEFAGAGSLALAWLHGVAGSSRTILEATDRYSTASLVELLGAEPEKIVEPETAAAMAQRAYLRSARLGEESRLKVGVGVTATIATDRAKRGEHRCCVAVQDHQALSTMDLVLLKGRRDRRDEERIVGEMVVEAIAQGCEVAAAESPALLPEETIERRVEQRVDPIEGAGWTHIDAAGRRSAEGRVTGIVFCGSFNPLHYGHEAMASAAGRVMGMPVTFEIAAVNAEKTALGRGELERRLAQFWRRHEVLVTREPLFAGKAKLFPGCTFLVGYDTAVRLVDPRFYGGSEEMRDQALAEIAARGCRVMVAGRRVGQGFKTLADVAVPAVAGGLFIELPAMEFRADVSASDLRAMRNRTGPQ